MELTEGEITKLNHELNAGSEACDRAFAVHSPVLRDTHDHWRGGPDSFLGTAYSTFYIKGSSVFIDWKQFVDTHPHDDMGLFTAQLWAEYKRAATLKRTTRTGESMSLVDLFCDHHQARHGWTGAESRRQAKLLMACYLAHQAIGMIMELRTYTRLVDLLGEHRVRLATSADEKDDVDVFIDDMPVSIKCLHAFSVGNCLRYRKKSDRPLFYVNEHLETLIPNENGYLVRHSSLEFSRAAYQVWLHRKH